MIETGYRCVISFGVAPAGKKSGMEARVAVTPSATGRAIQRQCATRTRENHLRRNHRRRRLCRCPGPCYRSPSRQKPAVVTRSAAALSASRRQPIAASVFLTLVRGGIWVRAVIVRAVVVSTVSVVSTVATGVATIIAVVAAVAIGILVVLVRAPTLVDCVSS